MKHKKELIRLADSPDGTKVWYKRCDEEEWVLTSCPSWLVDYTYVVNDKHAEVRKASIDGKKIEVLNVSGHWCVANINHSFSLDFEYRIVEELVNKWQYVCERNGDYKVTNSRYGTLEEAKNARHPNSGWKVICPFTASMKKMRKDER